MFANQLALGNSLNNLIKLLTQFDIKPNFKKYAVAVMASAEISAYTGTVPVQHVMDILVNKCLKDMPPDIENNLVDRRKVESIIKDELTQVRKKWKGLIAKSLMSPDKDEHWAIDDLARRAVKDTDIAITHQLCARIAVMRRVYTKVPGRGYWPAVDNKLKLMRKEVNNDPETFQAEFDRILKKDKVKYGGRDFIIKDGTPKEWQIEVDRIIGEAASGMALRTETVAEDASSAIEGVGGEDDGLGGSG